MLSRLTSNRQGSGMLAAVIVLAMIAMSLTSFIKLVDQSFKLSAKLDEELDSRYYEFETFFANSHVCSQIEFMHMGNNHSNAELQFANDNGWNDKNNRHHLMTIQWTDYWTPTFDTSVLYYDDDAPTKASMPNDINYEPPETEQFEFYQTSDMDAAAGHPNFRRSYLEMDTMSYRNRFNKRFRQWGFGLEVYLDNNRRVKQCFNGSAPARLCAALGRTWVISEQKCRNTVIGNRSDAYWAP